MAGSEIEGREEITVVGVRLQLINCIYLTAYEQCSSYQCLSSYNQQWIYPQIT